MKFCIGFLFSSALSLSVGAQETITLVKVNTPPVIDGATERVWTSAPVTLVSVSRIPEAIVRSNSAKQTGKYAANWSKNEYTEIKQIEIRGVYTRDSIFFLVNWDDSSHDDQHKPWVWKGSKEEGEYIAGSQREDRLALSFPISGTFLANKLTAKASTMDVWHWKAARSNPVGLAHDKHHIVTVKRPIGVSAQHYDDQAEEMFIARPADGDDAPYQSNKVDPFTYQGDVVVAYPTTMPTHADALDVKAKGTWEGGQWTLEFGRKLDTGRRDSDTVFSPEKGGSMAVAVFDHAGDHFHAVSGEVKLVFEK